MVLSTVLVTTPFYNILWQHANKHCRSNQVIKKNKTQSGQSTLLLYPASKYYLTPRLSSKCAAPNGDLAEKARMRINYPANLRLLNRPLYSSVISSSDCHKNPSSGQPFTPSLASEDAKGQFSAEQKDSSRLSNWWGQQTSWCRQAHRTFRRQERKRGRLGARIMSLQRAWIGEERKCSSNSNPEGLNGNFRLYSLRVTRGAQQELLAWEVK